MMGWIGLCIGAFFGAIGRYLLSRWNKGRMIPLGTLAANLIGSLLLGIVIALPLSMETRLMLGTGFMGSLTTFSTFNVENIEGMLKKHWRQMVLYMTLTFCLGLILAFIGMRIGQFMISIF
ncbi:fluoride efflux transporter CrcB [Tuberibacillus sp. Marseille-P3662]|uniref:fluoride efflux transporter CrcB n=1 Tax=Tuberibacillus sp. Marseille-P3662 TaxID=1965358 RepID=UPI000A1CC2BD|nr:fluoride efflux transporter CrcB [Tuberibacillus sp. Marseille-P3662]